MLEQNLSCLEVKLADEVYGQMTQLTETVKRKLGENADMWAAGEDGRIY
jgi:hypothetical protein